MQLLVSFVSSIIKDTPILVLDEAASALGSESEKLIQDTMDELIIEQDSIVASHHLSTIAKLNRIIISEDGKIIEDDTHIKNRLSSMINMLNFE